ncbi:MAG: hypothetical protein LCH54_08240 [Bacteroidetes bacterium]|nr:hypothetical protein [Bacteroidota bacterium]
MRLRFPDFILPVFISGIALFSLSSCSDEKPGLGTDLINPDEKPVFNSLNTDSLPLTYSVTYIEYNPVTSTSTRFVIGNEINPAIGTLHATAALRLLPDTEAFKPDSLIKVISARFFLSPYFVSRDDKSLPYFSGDTLQPFHLEISERTTSSYFSSMKLKDKVEFSSTPIADTVFTGTQKATFSFAVKDTNWVRKMISGMKNLTDTTALYKDNPGLVIHSASETENRTLGFYGFATNESIYNYDLEPRLVVKSLVKNGSSTDTITVNFSINAGNQLSTFKETGSYWSDGSRLILAGLSGKRALVKFSDPTLLPSKVLYYSSFATMKLDSSISSPIGTDYFSIWRNGSAAEIPDEASILSPGAFSQFSGDGSLSIDVKRIFQEWSFGQNYGFFVRHSGELNRAEMTAIFLTTQGTSKKPSFTLIYTGL